MTVPRREVRNFLFIGNAERRARRSGALRLEALVAVAIELRPFQRAGLACGLHLFPFGAAFCPPLLAGHPRLGPRVFLGGGHFGGGLLHRQDDGGRASEERGRKDNRERAFQHGRGSLLDRWPDQAGPDQALQPATVD